MRPTPSNPITGLTPRPEQSALGAPQWKNHLGVPGLPEFPEFHPQSVCGMCQGTCHYFTTDYEALPSDDSPYFPIDLRNWLLTKHPLRSYSVDLAEQVAGGVPLSASIGALLEYTRCHWKSSRHVTSFNTSGPPPNPPADDGGEVMWYLFYGHGDNSTAAAASDDLSMGGIGVGPTGASWISQDLAQNSITFPFPEHDSEVFCLGPWRGNPNENLLIDYTGWVLALVLREYIPNLAPDPGGVVWFYPILLYQVESTFLPDALTGLPIHPFRCTKTNRWSCTYNPCKFSPHLLITKPFQA